MAERRDMAPVWVAVAAGVAIAISVGASWPDVLAQAPPTPPVRLMGPNAPYNPRDLNNIRPFDEAARPGVARALKGHIDLHLHLSPADAERPLDAIDAAKVAKDMGLRAILITSHYESTASTAYLVRKAIPGIDVFGGISFEMATGGINAAAVEQMLKVKGGYGRMVEFPTFDVEWRAMETGKAFVPVSKNGVLVPEARQVIALIAKHNLLMSTGHVTPEEALLLVREANRQGVKHMVIGHNGELTVEQMREAVKLGAFIEFAKQNDEFPGDSYPARIRSVGPKHSILAETGVSLYPPDMVGALVAALHKHGFSDQEIDLMMKVNPAKVLGLAP